MNRFGTAFLRGLGIVLPVGVTIYVVFALGYAAERAVGSFIRVVIPDAWYWPGVGLIVAIGLIFAVGLMVRLPGMGLMVYLTEWLFERLPVIRSLYSMLKDVVEFMSASKESGGSQPVLVTIAPGTQLIGMVTNSNPSELGVDDDKILVYMPMSYQIGGYSVVVSKDSVTNLDMSFEDAMSYVVTAGVRSKKESDRTEY